jgi:glycerophosphoryl diester phosphodiesterase
MKLVVLLCTLPLAAAALFAADLRSAWNLRDHIAFKDVTVQSHRGAGVLMPENSIDAFDVAWGLGTVPEADLRTTKDGVIVAFHDEDFSRILPSADSAQQKRGIKDLNWAEVAALDIGAWKGPKFAGQHVPRLSDVYRILQQHPARRLYIDIKNVDLDQLARDARSAEVAAQLILASTDYAIIRRWKELAPESATLHWMGGTEEVLGKRIDVLRASGFAAITQLQLHVRLGQDGTMTPSAEFLMKTGAELRSHNILFQTLPWQSNDPAIFRRLMDLGCASFATDYPDVAMKTIREYYDQRR